MTYDRDLWDNPLRRLRSRVSATPNLEPNLRRHLNHLIDKAVASCTSITTQQAAARAIMAHWMCMRLEEQMLVDGTDSKRANEYALAYQKYAGTANFCFRVAGIGEETRKRGGRTPTSSPPRVVPAREG